MHPWYTRSLLAAMLVAVPHVAAQTIQWEPVGNPPGGVITRCTYDAADDALLAIAAWPSSYNNRLTAGAIYRSTDRGASWSVVSADIRAANPNFCRPRDLALLPGGVVLAAIEGNGVFRSTNSGINWTASSSGLTSLTVHALGVDPAGTVYAGTQSAGIFTSTNGGVNWTPANTGFGNQRAQGFAFGSGYAVVATAGGGVYKRIGSGAWMPANNGLTTTNIGKLLRLADGRILVGSSVGAFVSSDAAQSWGVLAGPFAGDFVGVLFESAGDLVVGGDAGVFRSLDGGTNWSPLYTGSGDARGNEICSDNLGNWYLATAGRGVFISPDHSNWVEANDGIAGHTIHRLIVTRDGTIVAGMFGVGIVRSTDGGQTWQQSSLASRFIFSLAESPWGDLFAGNYTINEGVSDGHAWRSRDQGATWQMIDTGIPMAAMISGFAFGAPGQVWLSCAWNPGGIFASTNSGDTWTRLGPPQNIPAYCIARSNVGDFYFGSEGRSVWRLPAGGSTWIDLGMSQSQQFSIATAANGTVYVGHDRHLTGVYRSTDGGQTFLPAPNFPGQEGQSIVTLPNNEVYAATLLQGVQHSSDNGQTWQTENAGLPGTMSFCLTLGPDGRLYSGQPGFGVYRTTTPVNCAPLGDLNLDQVVDLSDLANLLAHFGNGGATFADGDLNADTSVNLTDLAMLLASFGTRCA
ncbi:MAG: hypothetical protein ACKVS9_06085 [Phycisphaerae bacterium]